MKKISVILAVLVVLVLAGCATGGGGGGSTAAAAGGGAAAYSVPLDSFRLAKISSPGDVVGPPIGAAVKNTDPFTKNYDDLLLLFPADMPDVTKYQRVTIRCKYFNADGAEIGQGDSNAMVSLIYDLTGDLRGPAMGPGANTPLKEFNVGGFSGQVSTDRGMRLTLKQNPAAVLFQNSNVGVKFIEVTEVSFHN
jgi:hypothetical protein